MLDAMANPEFWILYVTLISAVWWQYRSIRRDSLKTGLAMGIEFGVKQASILLTTGKYSVHTDEGVVYNNAILIEELIAKVTSITPQQLANLSSK